MEAAEKLFAKNGYAETSIRQIAKASHSNSAMIFYYFGSKEKLMKALVEYRMTDFSRHLDQPIESLQEPFDKLRLIAESYVDKAFMHRDFFNIAAQLRASRKEIELLDYLKTIKEHRFNVINDILETGKRQGIFKSETSTSLLTALITGTLSYLVSNLDFFSKMEETANTEGFAEIQKDQAKKALIDMLRVITIKGAKEF